MRKTMELCALVLLALIVVASPSSQQVPTTRYVNKTDPTCGGHTPCYTTLQAAVDAVQPGETILIQAGVYDAPLSIKGKNNSSTATETNRILIAADPAAPVGSVVLRGTGQSSTPGDAIVLEASKFITLRGLTITNAGRAIVLAGGNKKQNDAIHIERNRIFGNGNSQCRSGILVRAGNIDTLIVNNLIYGNGRDGLRFSPGTGGTHAVVNNTIHGNNHDGVRIGKGPDVVMINNLITGNGAGTLCPATDEDTEEGDPDERNAPDGFGIKRKASGQPEQVQLLSNLICGNASGELSGPLLDKTDANNQTPSGSEGPGVVASPGCQVAGTVYANVNGPDGLPNTADDDFTLATASPAIDRGVDPRTLQLGVPNAILEADFARDNARPQDGDHSGTAEFDIGALEKQAGQCTPGKTEECYDGPSGTKGVGLCKAGTKTCQSNGTFGSCVGEVLPASEIPNNGIDEDCNGSDAQCTPGTTQSCYDGPSGTAGVGICHAGTKTCSAAGTFGACQGEVVPAAEIPGNGIDENCDGSDSQAAFTLSAAPATAEVIQGQSVSYVLMVNGTALTQLATLGLSGLPAGVTGSLNPQHVAAGQTSLLTVATPNGQPSGSVSLSVSASASVNGTNVTQSTTLTLNILPVTTSFVGRTVVADALRTPLAGVSISLLALDGDGKATGCMGETVSDAAGNFMFTNLPPECTGGQLIRYDGTTATSPPGKHAGVDLLYTIVPNQVTTSPVLIHLPRIDDKEIVCVRQDAPQDQTFSFQTIPDLSVTVYAHTTFTPHPQYPPPAGKCATGAFALIAIDVPVDRLPDAMPPDMQNVMPFIVAFQPPNAVASQPVAVSFPNLLDTSPGINLSLFTLDPTKGVMVKGSISYFLMFFCCDFASIVCW